MVRPPYGSPEREAWEKRTRPAWDFADDNVHIFHGTDSDTFKIIQARGMDVTNGVDVTADWEPKNRLWFGHSAQLVYGFAGRRVETGGFTLAEREASRIKGEPLPAKREDWTEEDWDIYVPIEAQIAEDRKHLTKVILRLKRTNIPSDCSVEDYEGEFRTLSHGDYIGHVYTILDDCNIPASSLEICNLPEETLDDAENGTIDNDIDVI